MYVCVCMYGNAIDYEIIKYHVVGYGQVCDHGHFFSIWSICYRYVLPCLRSKVD